MDLEHLGLFQQISSEWITLGECLGISAPALNVLQTKYMFSSYTSCVMVFQRWINNDGFPSHYPVTWQGLYDVLFDIHMGRIAMEMKEKLSMEGIIVHALHRDSYSIVLCVVAVVCVFLSSFFLQVQPT